MINCELTNSIFYEFMSFQFLRFLVKTHKFYFLWICEFSIFDENSNSIFSGSVGFQFTEKIDVKHRI